VEGWWWMFSTTGRRYWCLVVVAIVITAAAIVLDAKHRFRCCSTGVRVLLMQSNHWTMIGPELGTEC